MLSLALVAAAGTAARPAPARADGPWPLGTLQVVSGQVNGCPREFQCENMQILNCPNVMLNQYGAIAESDPVGPARGVVVFIDGGGANEWWADVGTSGETFQWHLRDDDHFVIMELRFAVGWAVSEPGEQTGPAHVACRPATTIKWIHDNVYLPLGLHPWAGQCGFCVTGNSGGASAVAYGLPFYGLDTILDADIPTGGPDHAAITKACLEVPGYEYNDNHRHSIDNSYGYYNQPLNPGPCFNEDPTWAPTWDADSIDIGGNDYDHPNTRVEFIEGGLDDTGAPAHGADYRQRLLQDPANHVTWTFIPTMPHHISTDPNGQAAIEASLLKAIGPVTTITSGPSDPTNQTSAELAFSADDPAATFVCTLDGGAGQACTSPAGYGGLAQGLHTFTVQGTDAQGEVGPPATYAWTVDTTPPSLVSAQMLDTNANGRVDQVQATFSETLGPDTAGIAQWTASQVPSSGTLQSVSVAGPTATLSFTEGAGPPDTSVGSFTLALTAMAGGIADLAGNLASFGPTAPLDRAGPVPVNVKDTNGTVDGQIESGDTLIVRFSEALSVSSIPATVVTGESDPAGTGNDLLSLGAFSKGFLSTGSDGYVTTDGATLRFGATRPKLSNGNATVTIRVGASCTGSCSAAAPGGPGTFVFVPGTKVADGAGNAATGSFSVPNFRLF